MNQNTCTLNHVVESLAEEAKGHHDKTVPASAMHFHDLNCVDIAGYGQFRMAESAKRTVASHLRIPRTYLNRCDTELQATNLNAWIGKLGEKPMFLRFDGDHMRALFTDRYQVNDNLDITRHLSENVFGPGQLVEAFSVSPEMMTLQIANDQSPVMLKGNDEVRPGITFTNSEVGYKQFGADQYVVRLVCSNGLVAEDKASVKLRHVKRNAMDVVGPGLIREIMDRARETARELHFTMDSPVDDPYESIGSFAKRYGLSDEMRQTVEFAYENEPGRTLFHVVNAFTAAANMVDTVELSHELQTVGGKVAKLIGSKR